MRIDKNYKGEKQELILSLLSDIDEINQKTKNKIYIEQQDYHNRYSPERTEPCPDYFGYYSLKIENVEGECLEYEPMTLDELDSAICVLCGFCEFCI